MLVLIEAVVSLSDKTVVEGVDAGPRMSGSNGVLERAAVG